MSSIVVYRLEKSYVDKLVARNPLYFNLVSTKFLLTNEVSNRLTVYYDMSVDSSKKGISLESSIVVQELKFALNLALYGLV